MIQEKWWIDAQAKVKKWCLDNGYANFNGDGDYEKHFGINQFHALHILVNFKEEGPDFYYGVSSEICLYTEKHFTDLQNAMKEVKADFERMLKECNLDNHNIQQLNLFGEDYEE